MHRPTFLVFLHVCISVFMLVFICVLVYVYIVVFVCVLVCVCGRILYFP